MKTKTLYVVYHGVKVGFGSFTMIPNQGEMSVNLINSITPELRKNQADDTIVILSWQEVGGKP